MAIEHRVDIARIGEAFPHCDIGEPSVVDNTPHCKDSRMDCTWAVDIAGSDYKAFSCPNPAACLALPADDDRSSCRLGDFFQTDRVRGRVGAARRRTDSGRVGSFVFGLSISAHGRAALRCAAQLVLRKETSRAWSQWCRTSRVEVCRYSQNYGDRRRRLPRTESSPRPKATGGQSFSMLGVYLERGTQQTNSKLSNT